MTTLILFKTTLRMLQDYFKTTFLILVLHPSLNSTQNNSTQLKLLSLALLSSSLFLFYFVFKTKWPLRDIWIFRKEFHHKWKQIENLYFSGNTQEHFSNQLSLKGPFVFKTKGMMSPQMKTIAAVVFFESKKVK